MGANEKYEAAMHGYVPDIGQIRDAWVDSKIYHLPKSTRTALVPTVQAEFDRWLETVRAEAKAEAAIEVANEFQYRKWAELIQGNMQQRLRIAQPITDWLRTRANQHKEQS